MADCVIVLKSGVKLEVDDVNWKKLTVSVSEAAKLNTQTTFMLWDNLIINLNDISAIYKKETGIRSA